MTGKELTAFRKSLKLSQAQFCELLGVKTRTISTLEKSDDIGTLYANAAKYLMLKQQAERLKNISDESGRLMEILS